MKSYDFIAKKKCGCCAVERSGTSALGVRAPVGHGVCFIVVGVYDSVRPDDGCRVFWGGQSRPPLQPFNVPGVFTVRAVEDAGPYEILPHPFVGGGVPDAPLPLFCSHETPLSKNRYLYESHLTARRKIAILQYHEKYHSAVKTSRKGEQYDP